MSDLPLHRNYLHYSELGYSRRILYTATLFVLGLGYLFALLNVYYTYAGKAGGNPLLLTPEDLIVAYSGSGKASRLEAALRGPMSTMLPREELNTVIKWAQDGAARASYEKDVTPILDKRCMACHDGSNPHLPNLGTYDNLKKVTEKDTGATVATLVRVSHIHLFGVTLIFFVMGLMFTHAYLRPIWLKCTIIAFPYFAIMVDVISWYIIKLFHLFVFVEMAAGMLMAACFAVMWLITMYQMWFSPPPLPVVQRMGGNFPDIELTGGTKDL